MGHDFNDFNALTPLFVLYNGYCTKSTLLPENTFMGRIAIDCSSKLLENTGNLLIG